jgi:hypothetical protein
MTSKTYNGLALMTVAGSIFASVVLLRVVTWSWVEIGMVTCYGLINWCVTIELRDRKENGLQIISMVSSTFLTLVIFYRLIVIMFY